MHIDPDSCRWVVVYIEMVTKTADFLIQEVYDKFRLWAVSPQTISFSRELNLVPVIGNQVNVDEYLVLLRVIERTDFSQILSTWRAHGENKEDHSPGHVDAGAAWMYYDPHDRSPIGEADAKRLHAREGAQIYEDHPIGLNFDASPGGWVGTDTAGAVEEDDERGRSRGEGDYDNDESKMDEVENSGYTYGGPSAACD